MEVEKTTLEETLEELEKRVTYFSTQRISAENVLLQPSSMSVRSLSEIIPNLASYDLQSTPLQMNLADIYLGR